MPSQKFGGIIKRMTACKHIQHAGGQDTLKKELEATTSLESSKAALEAEQQELKDLVASLEEKLQEQKRLTDVEAEAKAALEAKLEEAQASEINIKTKFQAAKTAASAAELKLKEFEASQIALTAELQQTKAAEAASVELNGELVNKLEDADERAASLARDLTAAQECSEWER